MQAHPYADIFPKLEGDLLRELADDIKERGLREAIWTYQGKILDGRNRYAACMLAGVKADLRAFKGSDTEALSFVVSANIRRRHLTVEQRAMAAAKVATIRKGAIQQTPKNVALDVWGASTEAASQAQAAEQFGVSRSSVQRARKVVEQGSASLQKAVQDGEVSLARGAAVVALPKADQLKAAQEKPPEDDGSEPDANESERLEAMQAEYLASVERVMTADDKLSAANAELKRQAAEIATLKSSRDHWQNKCAALQQRVNKLQSKLDRMKKP